MQKALLIILIAAVSFNTIAFADGFMGFFKGKDDNAAPFSKTTFIDRSLEDVKKKFGGSLRQDSCTNETTKSCNEKFKKACKCYKVILARVYGKSQDLFITINDGKVVESTMAMNAIKEVFPTLDKVESFAGDTAPDRILQGEVSNGIESYILGWKGKEKNASAIAFCPNGVQLRRCYLYREEATYLEGFSNNKVFASKKEVKKDY